MQSDVYHQCAGTGDEPLIYDGLEFDFDQWLVDPSLDPAHEHWLTGLAEGGRDQTWSSLGPDNNSPSTLAARDTRAQPKRRRGRLYKGCQTCRERKIKCDGRRPTCNNCERSRRHTCHGYFEETGSPVSKRHKTLGETNFSPMAPGAANIAGPESAQQDLGRLINSSPLPARGDEDATIETTAFNRAVRNLPAIRNHEAVGYVGEDDPGLLQHYQNVVGHFLMPTIDPSRNPYLQIYLPLATAPSPTCATAALRHALLCVGGSHMQQVDNTRTRLHQDTEAHGRDAERLIEEALHHLSGQSDDYRFALLAAAFSMLHADVFGRETLRCGSHLDVVRDIVRNTGDLEFWQSSATARTLYQMFRCYEVIDTTSHVASRHVGSVKNIAAFTAQTSESTDRDLCDSVRPVTHKEDPPEGFNEAIVFPSADEYSLEISFGISLRTISLLRRALRIEQELQGFTNGQKADALQMPVDALRSELLAVEADKTAFAARSESSHALPLQVSALQTHGASSFSETQASLPPVIRDELAENHQWAFHYAVVVFFGRVLASSGLDGKPRPKCRHDGAPSDTNRRQPYPGSETTASYYQVFIGKILDKLENIDYLIRDTTVQPANTLWPIFIAAVEALDVQLRQRSLILLNRASKRGIGNIVHAKDLAMEIWRRVDRQLDADGSRRGLKNDLGPVDWRSVMSELGCSIMLT